MEIKVSDVKCPTCGANEMHPTEQKLLIRGFKVCDEKGRWWSQCLVCAGYYDKATLLETPDKFDRNAGWF